MVDHLPAAMAQVKRQLSSHLPIDIDELARESGYHWRERKLSPRVTLWLFMVQVLNGNVAITALRHLGQVAMTASSYCAARQRLPLDLFARLFDAMSQAAGVVMEQSTQTLWNGRRVLLADVTTFSMPDTPALREQFGYPAGQRPGLGFPVGRLLGVIDALSGCVLMAMGCPLFTHEARQMLSLHPLLKKGDVLVADCAFCSYLQIALLLQHGVDVVMRLHQRRPKRWQQDLQETWKRPAQCPPWMNATIWAWLPEQLTIRIVRYTIACKGYRTRHVHVATTLLEALAYPPEIIQQLYGHRWQIETCFNQLKTHARMNALKSRTVDGVMKELMIYLIVWNLVRMTMAKFAQRAGVSVWRVSFIDTVRALCVLLQPERPTELNLLLNPVRPERWEPRKLKRRMKEYDLLKEPRQNIKSKHRARYA
jgi:hypothetical protein